MASLKLSLTLCLIAAASLFEAASTGKSKSKSSDISVSSQDNVRSSLDGFSLDLYKALSGSSDAASTNLFFSPLSISSCLLLAYAGAKGTTQDQIAKALRLQGSSPDTIIDHFSTAFSVFSPPQPSFDGELPYNLSLANRAYIEKTLNVKKDYINTISNKLNSTVGVVDFHTKANAVRQEINKWVESQTNGKIKNLLQPGTIDSSTLMVLINAIYFKAAWVNQFVEGFTTKEDFFNLKGVNSKVDLMNINGKMYQYFDNLESSKNGMPAFHTLAIPYKTGDLSLLVFLPKEKKGLPALEKALTAANLDVVYKGMTERKANVYLPKFKVEKSFNLGSTLQSLGVEKMFNDADFSGISDSPMRVSAVVHKAFIEVNEKGTEAAAATAAVMTRTAMFIERDILPPVEFRADHPFLFVIRHEKTGLITFMGRIASF
ncbi:hypothetical protein RvY_14815 [Ramazzottius varieornatus]|uniref:Serpin domain-containing protein n=1 Tax=Ramazzottius varieornatus TaxID=947166 RepID=A0A1D1VSK1_RAMVA|nr:hypothetical protein RvY_14815 [Ramazzottius varieornatus]